MWLRHIAEGNGMGTEAYANALILQLLHQASVADMAAAAATNSPAGFYQDNMQGFVTRCNGAMPQVALHHFRHLPYRLTLLMTSLDY